jgi:hypothetical protein
MKKYKFGDCIPEAVKVYNRLKRQGKTPQFVEGWVEIDYQELLPETDFLELYYPEILAEIENNENFDDYIRVFQHTWITCDGEIIDITQSQFDKFGGIVKYYEKMRYIPKIKVKSDDISDWFDERDYTIKRNKYIRFPEEKLKT